MLASAVRLPRLVSWCGLATDAVEEHVGLPEDVGVQRVHEGTHAVDDLDEFGVGHRSDIVEIIDVPLVEPIDAGDVGGEGRRSWD